MLDDTELSDALRNQIRATWHLFLDEVLPLRAALHAYCQALCGDLWEAEDLLQAALVRAFAQAALIHHHVRDLYSHVLRAANDTWREGASARSTGTHAVERALAAADLLAPRAELDAWHAAAEGESPSPPRLAPVDGERGSGSEPARAVVERFVALYNARDRAGILELILEDGRVDMVGSLIERGRSVIEQRDGWLDRVLFGHPEWPPALQFDSPRLESVEIDGELMALGYVRRHGVEAMESVLRFLVWNGRIARIRYYVFCPEVVRAIGAAFDEPVRTGLYRYPTVAPGVAWADVAARGSATEPGAP